MLGIDWLSIKNEYIHTATSYRKLAEKYGVNKDTIAKRAKAERWIKTKDIQTDKIQTAVIQKTSDTIVAKEVNRIERIHTLSDKLIEKLEQATVQLDSYLVTNKIKIKTVERDNKAEGKPHREITTETENISIVDGIVDRQGLKHLTGALKDIYAVVEPARDSSGDGILEQLIRGLKDNE